MQCVGQSPGRYKRPVLRCATGALGAGATRGLAPQRHLFNNLSTSRINGLNKEVVYCNRHCHRLLLTHPGCGGVNNIAVATLR